MRFRARPSALFAVLLLLALPAVAAADPKPILKPEDKPVQPAPSPPPAAPSAPPVHVVNTTPASVAPKKTVTPVVTKPPPVLPSQGGRDQSGVVVTTVTPPAEPVVEETPVTAVPAPDPTPLALVGASERESEPSTATPPWKLALLALLAAAEAFLLVRLVRNRPTGLSPIH